MKDWTISNGDTAQQVREIRQPQIVTECAAIAETVEVVAKLVAELESRLGPALRPIVDLDAEKAREAEAHRNSVKEPLAPHAEFLRMRVQVLRTIANQLEGIHKRLEI